MKRILLIILVFTLFLSLAACQKSENSQGKDTVTATDPENIDPTNKPPSEATDAAKPNENNDTDISLLEMIERIYALKDPQLNLESIAIDLKDPDAVKYYSGLDNISKIEDIVASEALISSQAYSLVLVQTESEAASKEIAEQMLEGIDPRKWICIEADDVQLVSQDDLVMLVMVASDLEISSQDLIDAFSEIREGIDLQLKK